jgi:hypothetical protein
VEQRQAEFTEFYERSRADCLRIVLVSVGDCALAEDLVAEGFARAWTSWSKVRRHPAPHGWPLGTFCWRARELGPDRALAGLALPWLMLPPLILIAASEIMPVYNGRYVTYCLPAVALLAATGLAALPLPGGATALVLIAALVAPQQLGLRVQGAGMRTVAAFLNAHERPGDAIVYPGPSIAPWYLAYPEGFARLRDVSLGKSPGNAGTLYASSAPLAVQKRREREVSRIWAVQMAGTGTAAPYLAPGFRLAREWKQAGGRRR